MPGRRATFVKSDPPSRIVQLKSSLESLSSCKQTMAGSSTFCNSNGLTVLQRPKSPIQKLKSRPISQREQKGSPHLRARARRRASLTHFGYANPENAAADLAFG